MGSPISSRRDSADDLAVSSSGEQFGSLRIVHPQAQTHEVRISEQRGSEKIGGDDSVDAGDFALAQRSSNFDRTVVGEILATRCAEEGRRWRDYCG